MHELAASMSPKTGRLGPGCPPPPLSAPAHEPNMVCKCHELQPITRKPIRVSFAGLKVRPFAHTVGRPFRPIPADERGTGLKVEGSTTPRVFVLRVTTAVIPMNAVRLAINEWLSSVAVYCIRPHTSRSIWKRFLEVLRVHSFPAAVRSPCMSKPQDPCARPQAALLSHARLPTGHHEPDAHEAERRGTRIQQRHIAGGD